jgi:Arc/MetJ family transcription regulator
VVRTKIYTYTVKYANAVRRLGGGQHHNIDGASTTMHSIHMKRTNLVLDEDVLREAQALSKKRTYSETVNEALREYCRLHKVSRIFDLADSGIWEGRLEDMREDSGVG